ncbi:hypothetical protein TNIN_78041 [Trichonephila inaurata madagascariensis]|uniref:Uncharacterized protein n=1 Tax=Trichonephila inaurata madagascariensis TaxID=2747483 RepID=A0A8X6X675_9ARAC|nr:hypothetical protein TNIN_78041 [Trichonephila inaurata madagascariensis]
MLSETWLDNEERVSIPNFDCCVQFKRLGHRAFGVAIYRKQKNSHVVTSQMDITYCQTSGLEFYWSMEFSITFISIQTGVVSHTYGIQYGRRGLLSGQTKYYWAHRASPNLIRV